MVSVRLKCHNIVVTTVTEKIGNLKGFDVFKYKYLKAYMQHEMAFTILTSDKKVGLTL